MYPAIRRRVPRRRQIGRAAPRPGQKVAKVCRVCGVRAESLRGLVKSGTIALQSQNPIPRLCTS